MMDFEIYMSKMKVTTTSFESNFYRLILEKANEAVDEKNLTVRQHTMHQQLPLHVSLH